MKRSPPPVPAALARRAKKAATLGHARHEARARELVALVLDKKREIAAAFWDVGDALRQLAAPELWGALGYATFDDAVEKETGIGRVLAAKLVSLASRLPRSLAERLGQEKAAALLRLADARGESDATVLATKRLRLPGRHEAVRPIDLGANELKRAVRDEQIARGKGRDVRAKGLAEAHAVADAIAAELAKKGVEARVEARTTRRGGGIVRIDVPVEARAIVGRALARS